MKLIFFGKTMFVTINSLFGNNSNLIKLDNDIKTNINKDPIIKKYNVTINTEYRVKNCDRYIQKLKFKKTIPKDRLGLRIIYDTDYHNNEFISYYIMKNIEDRYSCIFGKDYIINKKTNGYQSLHINIDYDNMIYELQIRSKFMDNCAKYGSASDYYK